MTITCKVTLNGYDLYPELPLELTLTPIGQDLPLLNGGKRFYWRRTLREWTLNLRDGTESERNTWLAAAVVSTSVPFVDEHGVTHTVQVTNITPPLMRTVPAVEGGTNTTGPGYYDLSVSFESIQ